ncbi:membrane hypothetical protein [Vibrio chagasii]|nr:membrane hypothetical protein [Vibrio chagasii]
MLKDTILLIIGLGLGQAFTLLTNFILIKSLDSNEYSVYVFILSIATASVTSLLSSYNRIKVAQKSPIQNKDILGIPILLGGVACFVMYFLTNEVKNAILCFFLAISLCIFEIGRTSVQSDANFKKLSIYSSLRSIIFFIFVLLLNFTIDSIYNIYVTMLLCLSYITIGGLLISSSGNKDKITNENKIGFRNILLIIYFFALPYVSQIPLIILNKDSSAYDVSVFSVALSLIAALNTVVLAMKKVLIVKLRDGVSKNSVLITTSVVIVLFFFIMIFFQIFGEQVFYYYTSGKYVDSNDVFLVLLISVFITIMFSPTSEKIQLKGEYWLLIIALLFSLVSAYIFEILSTVKSSSIHAAFTYVIIFSTLNVTMFILNSVKNKGG